MIFNQGPERRQGHRAVVVLGLFVLFSILAIAGSAYNNNVHAAVGGGWGLHFRQGVSHLSYNSKAPQNQLNATGAMDWTSLGMKAQLAPLPAFRVGAEFSSGADQFGGLTYGGGTMELVLRIRKVDLIASASLGAAYGIAAHYDKKDEMFGKRTLYPYVEPGLGFRVNLDGGNDPDAAFGLRMSYWQPMRSLSSDHDVEGMLPTGNLGLTFELLTGQFL